MNTQSLATGSMKVGRFNSGNNLNHQSIGGCTFSTVCPSCTGSQSTSSAPTLCMTAGGLGGDGGDGGGVAGETCTPMV